jgi:anti-sigma factor RsiW
MTDVELHEYVDGQLPEDRHADVQAWLAAHPDDAVRVAAWQALNEQLHGHFDPVLNEASPLRLQAAARGRLPGRSARRFNWALAASFVGAVLLAGGLGGAIGYHARPAEQVVVAGDAPPPFARRAMVAHAVYSPDARRAVEVDAAHEDQLVRWLSKRLNAPLHVPQLQSLGYALEGGRLLPGNQGPVAQFMYRDAAGGRLTLYVSNESPGAVGTAASAPADAAFRFAHDGAVNSFYWVDGRWGYAISAGADRAVLAQVSAEVYRQLAAR